VCWPPADSSTLLWIAAAVYLRHEAPLTHLRPVILRDTLTSSPPSRTAVLGCSSPASKTEMFDDKAFARTAHKADVGKSFANNPDIVVGVLERADGLLVALVPN
jgi:hypothetical protein